MKRFICGAILLAAALNASAAVKVACVGDSITFGSRVENRERLSYPAQLAQMLGEDYQVKNFGVSGRTLLKKGNLPFWKEGAYRQALKWEPEVVIIKLGTNDTKMGNWTHEAEFEQDLAELARSFTSLPSQPKVFLALPVPAFCTGDGIDGTRVREGVIPYIKNVAKAQDLPTIDFHARMRNKELMMPDKVHPNAEGAFELASEAYSAITGKSYKGSFSKMKPIWAKGLPLVFSDWHGFRKYDFRLGDSACSVVAPEKAAAGNPWIWRARFFGHEPQTDIALLNRGFHVAYCDVADLFGSPTAVARWDAFYDYAVNDLGFSEKVTLEGMSRGGLIVFNWAYANPEKVHCIYADAPVCDFKSWPGGKGTGDGHAASWNLCMTAYGFQDEVEALAYKKNPVNRAEALAKAKIPVLMVYGKTDVVVPPAENCERFAEQYKRAGGPIRMIGKANNGHHPHSLKDPFPIVEYILRASDMEGLIELPMPPAIEQRAGLGNSFNIFSRGGKARVAFLGGSITEMPGWRNLVAEALEKRFPKTEFDFVFAGIASTDSTLGAFRLEHDVFSAGKVDLLFIESAVNELHNKRTQEEIQRAVEGIVRQAIRHNPEIDVVAQYFADNEYVRQVSAGSIPWQVETINTVMARYQFPSINQTIALNTALRAGELTPSEFASDGCHPATKGHRLYADHIDALFDACWSSKPHSKTMRSRRLPPAVYPDSFGNGRYVDIRTAKLGDGWTVVENWTPPSGGTRKQFVNLPVIEATEPGAELRFEFAGRAVGIVIPAGPDAGIIEYKVDDGAFKSLDLFTQWSAGLHLPWIYMLETGLAEGRHVLTLRMTDQQNKKSKGTACRICYFAVNGPEQ